MLFQHISVLSLIKKLILTLLIAPFVLAVMVRVVLWGLFGEVSSEHCVDRASSGREAASDRTVLNLPVTLPIASLRAATDTYLPESYTDIDDDPTDLLIDDTLTYNLRRGELDMGMSGDGIDFSFPVSGSVSIKGKVNLAVAEFDTSAHAEVAGVISGTIRFDILPDWRIEPDIRFRVDITKAKIPIKRLGSLSLRTFLEERLTKKINRKRARLAKKIMDKNVIRKKVADVWRKMHRVKRLNDDPSVWARVTPLSVGLVPLKPLDETAFSTGIRLTLSTEIIASGEKPPVKKTELPDAEILKEVPNRFSLYISAFGGIADLNKMVENELAGKTEEPVKDIEVTIERAEVVFPGNNRASAILFTKFRHKRFGLETGGRLYIHGNLTWCQDTGVLRFQDPEYDVVFTRWWVNTLHWVIAPYIRHEMNRRSLYNVGDIFAEAHEAINQSIETLVVPPGVKTELNVQKPELDYLSVEKDGVRIGLRIEGSLSAELEFSSETDFSKIKKE